MPTPPPIPLRQQLQADLRDAMRARDTSRVSVLRTTLSAIANAEAVDVTGPTVRTGLLADVQRVELTEDDIKDIARREREELASAAAEMRGLGQTAQAAELDEQAAILDGYIGR
jgi:uncharacterized protein YqeY